MPPQCSLDEWFLGRLRNPQSIHLLAQGGVDAPEIKSGYGPCSEVSGVNRKMPVDGHRPCPSVLNGDPPPPKNPLP